MAVDPSPPIFASCTYCHRLVVVRLDTDVDGNSHLVVKNPTHTVAERLREEMFGWWWASPEGWTRQEFGEPEMRRHDRGCGKGKRQVGRRISSREGVGN